MKNIDFYETKNTISKVRNDEGVIRLSHIYTNF